jgi:hypothetical protein
VAAARRGIDGCAEAPRCKGAGGLVSEKGGREDEHPFLFRCSGLRPAWAVVGGGGWG